MADSAGTGSGDGAGGGLDDVASAIADPVRREILLMLRDGGLSAGQVADRFAISRPAVSRHLRVLREAGLVSDAADGRRRVYALVAAPIDELAGWLARLTAPSGWEHHFDALETEVHRTRRERRTPNTELETEVHRTRRERRTSATDPRPATGVRPIQEETA